MNFDEYRKRAYNPNEKAERAMGELDAVLEMLPEYQKCVLKKTICKVLMEVAEQFYTDGQKNCAAPARENSANKTNTPLV